MYLILRVFFLFNYNVFLADSGPDTSGYKSANSKDPSSGSKRNQCTCELLLIALLTLLLIDMLR